MTSDVRSKAAGLDSLFKRPLLETIWRRRTHRDARGVSELKSGSMTYDSTEKPAPLSELEEAVLIAITGHTGLTMPDRPFQDTKTGEYVMAKPNLTMDGRTAGSPDNAQGTYFFLINDSGTYFLRKLPPPAAEMPFTLELLLERAKSATVRDLEKRLDVVADRGLQEYLSSN